MSIHWRSFITGATLMLILLLGSYFLVYKPEQLITNLAPSLNRATNTINAPVPSNAVTIEPLPSLQIIRGNAVPFEGKAEFRQTIAGRLAQNLTIVNFQATGEHAEKSLLKIVWENGEVDTFSPGSKDKKFAPERRAVEITIIGYSMHERPIFKDSSRKGTLTWEIRYEPVN